MIEITKDKRKTKPIMKLFYGAINDAFKDVVAYIEPSIEKGAKHIFKEPENAKRFTKNTSSIITGYGFFIALAMIAAISSLMIGTIGAYAVALKAPTLIAPTLYLTMASIVPALIGSAIVSTKLTLNNIDKESARKVKKETKKIGKRVKSVAIKRPILFALSIAVATGAAVQISSVTGEYSLTNSFSKVSQLVERNKSFIKQQVKLHRLKL